MAGFREVDHTADCELVAWAPDLAGLLIESAFGMYSLAGIRLRKGFRTVREIAIEEADRETLIVTFLSELLYFGENERLAFDEFDLNVRSCNLRAVLTGSQIAAQSKEIKAVTFHNLIVHETEEGLEVHLVFDV